MQPVEKDPEGKSQDPHRLDSQGRLLCTARRRLDGEPCNSPVVTGMKVCRMHGGASPQAKRKAKLRLAELVDPAIATLAREMTQAEKSADKQRAANSILDRAGVPRSVTSPDADAARDLLVERLKQLRTKQEAGTAPAAEDYEGTLE